MKFTLLTALLFVSTTAFSKPPVTGELSVTSGTSLACCPTGTCSDKNIPVCAGVTDLRNVKDTKSSSATAKRGKGSRTSQQ